MRGFQGFVLTLAALLVGLGSASAEAIVPAPGTDLRRDLLDTLRPLAAYDLGAPIEFRVLDMRVDGDVAFVQVMAQRPGGGAIDMAATPMVGWRFEDPYNFDGPRFEAFFVQDGGYWQITQYALGATDAWWYGYRCDVFGAVLQAYGC